MVPVAFVQVKSVKVRGFVTERFVNWAFVAKRLVEVTDVEVTSPRFAFQRRAPEPREKVVSSDGMRSVSTNPRMPRFVVVVLVPVAFVQVMFVGLKEPTVRFVKFAFVAKRLVVVTLVPVASVNVRDWRFVDPRTVKVLVTVLEDPMKPP